MALKQWGAKICGYSLAPNTDPSLFVTAKVADGIEHHIGDVQDLEHLRSVISKFQPDIVLHMAAQALVRASYEFPIETLSTNIMGTANILESIRGLTSVRSFVNVTTDKCYENLEHHRPYTEDEKLGGNDPYSMSKACSELVTASYRISFFKDASVGIASARAGNVIGGGDWSKDRLVPDLARGFAAGNKVVLRNLQSIRPWQHVLEPVSAYLLLAEKLFTEPQKYSQAWNFGPQERDCREVGFIVSEFAKNWGPNPGWSVTSEAQVHEANILKLDISKADRLLSWRPRYRLEKALELTATWYQLFYSAGASQVTELTYSQIQQYFNSNTVD